MSAYKHGALAWLLLLNITLQVGAFALTKYAAVRATDYIDLFLNIFYLSALVLIVMRAVVWQQVLRRAELSRVYPLNALVPVLVLLLGVFFFGETLEFNNILGLVFIALGLLLLMAER